jgi:hypothetical protein
MKRNVEDRRLRLHAHERGAARALAAIVLGVTVVAVGVVGYFVLAANSPSGTNGSTQHACEPANSPACKGNSTVAAVGPHVGAGLDPDAR